jgi:hypothetical protein
MGKTENIGKGNDLKPLFALLASVYNYVSLPTAWYGGGTIPTSVRLYSVEEKCES